MLFDKTGLFFSLFLIGAMIHRIPAQKGYKYLIFPALYLSCQTPWSGLSIQLADFIIKDAFYASAFLQSFSSVLLMLAILNSQKIKKLLSLALFVQLGKLSFSMYVLHLPIIMSVGSTTFIKTSHFIGTSNAAMLAIMTSLIVIFITSYATYRFIDIPSQKVAKFVGNKLAT